jgi:hypothetical protein
MPPSETDQIILVGRFKRSLREAATLAAVLKIFAEFMSNLNNRVLFERSFISGDVFNRSYSIMEFWALLSQSQVDEKVKAALISRIKRSDDQTMQHLLKLLS